MAEGNCLLCNDSGLILRRETELEQTRSGLVDSVQCDHWHGRGYDGRGLFNHGLVEWSNHTACTQRKRVAGGRFDADGLFGDRKKTQGGTSRRGFLEIGPQDPILNGLSGSAPAPGHRQQCGDDMGVQIGEGHRLGGWRGYVRFGHAIQCAQTSRLPGCRKAFGAAFEPSARIQRAILRQAGFGHQDGVASLLVGCSRDIRQFFEHVPSALHFACIQPGLRRNQSRFNALGALRGIEGRLKRARCGFCPGCSRMTRRRGERRGAGRERQDERDSGGARIPRALAAGQDEGTIEKVHAGRSIW